MAAAVEHAIRQGQRAGICRNRSTIVTGNAHLEAAARQCHRRAGTEHRTSIRIGEAAEEAHIFDVHRADVWWISDVKSETAAFAVDARPVAADQSQRFADGKACVSGAGKRRAIVCRQQDDSSSGRRGVDGRLNSGEGLADRTQLNRPRRETRLGKDRTKKRAAGRAMIGRLPEFQKICDSVKIRVDLSIGG
jgi:hypothetical protein